MAKRLGYDPFLAAARQTIIVDIALEQEELVGRVRLVDESGVARGSRDLRSSPSDCEELTASLALAISITLDPAAALELEASDVRPESAPSSAERPNDAAGEAHLAAGVGSEPSGGSGPTATGSPVERDAASVAPAPSARREPSPTAWLRAGVLGTAGMAPAPSAGFWAGLALERGRFRGSAEFRADLPAGKEVPGAGRIETSLLAGNLSACLMTGWLGFCLAGTTGARIVRASELPGSPDESVWFLGVGARVEAQVELTSRLWLLLNTEALGVVTPLAVRVSEVEVWNSPPVTLALHAGAKYQLF